MKRRNLEVIKRVMVVFQRPIPPKGQGIEQELELGIRNPGSQHFSLITPESDLFAKEDDGLSSLQGPKN